MTDTKGHVIELNNILVRMEILTLDYRRFGFSKSLVIEAVLYTLASWGNNKKNLNKGKAELRGLVIKKLNPLHPARA